MKKAIDFLFSGMILYMPKFVYWPFLLCLIATVQYLYKIGNIKYTLFAAAITFVFGVVWNVKKQ